MAHIPEEELVVYARNPTAISQERVAEIEREIAACSDCRRAVDFFSVTDDDLSDPDVWEALTPSATLESLRAYGAQIAAEDEEARALLKPLLDAAGRTAWRSLSVQARYRTGGVARTLIAHAAALHEREPLAALTFSDAAVAIAEALPNDLYPANAVYELRGTAWKERANALRFLGRFEEGLETLRRAERAYRQLASRSLGLATVAYVRGWILFEQERYPEAAEAAAIAERAFAHIGDDERQTRAIHLRANIAFGQRDLDTAITLFRLVLDFGEGQNDALWIARAAQALGSSYLEAGNAAEASIHFHTALALFRDLDLRTEIVRTEWGLARVVIDGGKLDDAEHRLHRVMTDFVRVGMVTDAALAGLDLADVFVATGRTREIVALAKYLFSVFTECGMLTSALAAIAYLRDGAATGRLTSTDIAAVRRFLPLAERRPALLFVPPSTFP